MHGLQRCLRVLALICLAGCASAPRGEPFARDPCAGNLSCRSELYAEWHAALSSSHAPAADFFLAASEVTRGGRWPPVGAGSIDAGAPVGPLARARVGVATQRLLRRLGSALYLRLHLPLFERLRAGPVLEPTTACRLLQREHAFIQDELAALGFTDAIDDELSALLNHRSLRAFFSRRFARVLRSFGEEPIRFSDRCHRLRIGTGLLRDLDPAAYSPGYCPCEPG